jgi:hypothetical protein
LKIELTSAAGSCLESLVARLPVAAVAASGGNSRFEEESPAAPTNKEVAEEVQKPRLVVGLERLLLPRKGLVS